MLPHLERQRRAQGRFGGGSLLHVWVVGEPVRIQPLFERLLVLYAVFFDLGSCKEAESEVVVK